jgi:ABC-type antimicrobial peptide transport system permease subunit
VLNGLYPRLAWVNLGKNRQTWLPYLFTCIGTIMMFYIMLTLDSDPALGKMAGGSTLGYMLDMGVVVIGFFAVILMFFAHSFIMKQRKKEFGLYNILGMEKRHIARLLAWETLYTAVIAYAAGIALGILFSKLMQLLLLKLLRFDIRFGLYVSPRGAGRHGPAVRGHLPADAAQFHAGHPFRKAGGASARDAGGRAGAKIQMGAGRAGHNVSGRRLRPGSQRKKRA